MKNQNNQENSNENKKKKSKTGLYASIIVLIIIIILLLLRSCGSQGPVAPVVDTTPQGTYEVGGKRDEPIKDEPIKEAATITFSGTGECEISKDSPDAEFFNPDVNIVDMIFTVIDNSTNEVVARTGKVGAGQYAYINLYDFYNTVGEYNVTVNISTFTAEGQQMNGVNQKMVVKVVE